jgi:hypothetical protein
MQLVIGLCGKAGSGKDTVSQLIDSSLRSYNISCITIHFAKALKDIAKSVFGWDGQKNEKGRRLLQVIGTDCARAYNENFWIEKWENNISNCSEDVVLVPDVRFINESQAIHRRNGVILKVVGRSFDLGVNSTHPSEIGLPENEVDYILNNDSSMDILQERVYQMIMYNSSFNIFDILG